ncbi:esterase [Yarrowia lipolytica]|jgi:carboxylesterase type B|uniref:Carboxylic ester hydrolase n=1 Tax=Yarrowia lipolytica TaxID=4952 RepID=A0A371CC09_YARLL|nr:esterase [Yarrowia lipolytica]
MTTINSKALNGSFEGVPIGETIQWKNVLYADVKHRFAPPILKTDFEGKTIDCTEDGYDCPQLPNKHDMHDGEYKSDELLCTNLRIVKPKGDFKHPLPVYLYIHGGANLVGNIYSKRTDPTPFVEHSAAIGKPVIMVVIEYRLGMLGYSTSKDGKGNWGLRDQWTSVQWVNKFIGEFGGDSQRVTVGGESSGSIGVHALVLKDGLEHHGVISRAFMSSGSLGCFPPLPVAYLDTYRAKAAKELGVEEADLDDPTKVPPYALVTAGFKIEYPFGFYAYDDFLPDNLLQAIPKLRTALVSDNDYEGSLFVKRVVPPAEIEPLLNSSETGKKVKDIYSILTGAEVCKFRGDSFFVVSNAELLGQLEKGGVDVYRQFFDQVDPFDPSLRARHAVDLVFMWKCLPNLPEWAIELANKYQTNLIKFVYDESPWPSDEVALVGNKTIKYGHYNPRKLAEKLLDLDLKEIRKLGENLTPAGEWAM